jgi:polysaccharide biosynthesis/export protein
MKVHNISLSSVLLIGLLISLVIVGFGQDQRPRSTSQNPRRDELNIENDSRRVTGTRGNTPFTSNLIVATDDDYILTPPDVIRIDIEDAPELSGSYRISKNGTIPMKFLGATPVAGKTTVEVTNYLTEKLNGRYLVDPKVFVSVQQYNSRTFFIQGSVRNPGVYIIEGKPSLFKLVTIAGGYTENHSQRAYIFREVAVSPEVMEKRRAGIELEKKSSETSAPTPIAQALDDRKAANIGIEGETDIEVITARINIIPNATTDQNMLIQPNDIVYIPPKGAFFVTGEVRSPGQYILREGTTLRQAIALAQGTFFKSATNRTYIFRRDQVTGKLTDIQVDISDQKSKAQEMEIMPDDVIYVPNSAFKSLTATIRDTLISQGLFRVINR